MQRIGFLFRTMVNLFNPSQKPISKFEVGDKSKKDYTKPLSLNDLCVTYRESVEENLKDIESILKDVGVDEPVIISSYKNILISSCRNLIEKWLSKRKYTRTLFVKEAFSDFYPDKYTKISLYIDALINILDDLLDEKIGEKEKKYYIVEFLRVFALYNQEQPSKKIQIAMGHYFNKFIALAIAEGGYKNIIKKEIDMEKIVKYSAKSYGIRSLDIDVFNQIALIEYKKQDKEIEKIKKIGRIFRAVNIIRKDIEDIEYDTKNNMESIITVIVNKKECDFHKYVLTLIDHYIDKARKIKLENFTERKFATPINNFYNMIEINKKEIKKRIKFL